MEKLLGHVADFLEGAPAYGVSLQARYLKTVATTLPLLGSCFFHVRKVPGKEVESKGVAESLPGDFVIAVNCDGVHFLDEVRRWSRQARH